MVDILHPAHVHFFKHFVREMRDRGHDVLLTARDKEMTLRLLENEGLDAVVLSAETGGRRRLAAELARRTRAFWRVAREFGPTALTGIMGPTIAPVGRLGGWPSVVFYDTEHAKVTNRWVYPMATHVVTPRAYMDEVGAHQVRYAGTHELAYLRPERFTPDPARIAAAGIDPDRPFAFVRFVAFQASHDSHSLNLDESEKRELINALTRHGQVVISSEAALPDDQAHLAYRGRPEDIHHVLACASVVAGDSATVSEEAAVLGVPTLYYATHDIGVVRELSERYGLLDVFPTGEFGPFLEAAVETASHPVSARAEAEEKRGLFLEETLDVTSFMVSFFEEHFGSPEPGTDAVSEQPPRRGEAR